MRPDTLFLSAVITVVLARTSRSPRMDDEPHERNAYAKIGVESQLADPNDALVFTGHDGRVERRLSPRLDLPGGIDVNLDDIANQVYDKVKGEVGQAVDTAQEGVYEAVDGAKKLLEDIKDAVEEVWTKVEEVWKQIQDKVRELEDKVVMAIHDWVWEHIIHPLIILLVLILLPFVVLFLWWLLHLLAKPFVREREMGIAMQSRGSGGREQGNEGELPPQASRGGRGRAYWLVHSWESYGQGLICFACPWYGNYVLWRSRNKMRKDMEKLKDETSRLRAEVNWVLKRGFAQRDGGHTK